MSEHTDGTSQLSPLKRALIALEKMQAKLGAVERAQREPIAVVGMSCRFPGGAADPEAYWTLLREGVDAIGDIPAERWNIDAYYDAHKDAAGKMYMRAGGFLERVDLFDAGFFGIAPREAAHMDPQQRLFLEVAFEAVERAGLTPEQLRGSQTGVFVGIMSSEYAKRYVVGDDMSGIDAYYAMGNEFSFTPGRLSYILGCHGPSMAVDTACSSSLVGLHLACQSLRSGECQTAIAGGVNLMLTPELSVYLCKARVVSPGGRSKTFDASADGIGRGEGCGVVVLKRLSDALRDGDPLLGVILGSAVNHDGPSGGLTVPSGPAQQVLLRQALASAGLEPAQIQYIEAHGTGTPLGDPIEIQALAAVLGQGRSQPLLLGSVKTNLGHLDAAAGMAGLIKTLLALQHRQIPPHLHLQQPTPHVAWERLPITIPTRLTEWPAQEQRIAGVSAFGLSGINAHVIVGSAPARPAAPSAADEPPFLLPLSARSPEALRERARALSSFLARQADNSDAGLGDLCYTASMRRGHYEQRLAVVGGSRAELIEKLELAAGNVTGPGIASGTAAGDPPRTVFVFCGQGTQWAGMGRDLLEREPVFRAEIEACDRLLQPIVGWSLLERLRADEPETRLDDTAVVQPLLFAVQVGLCALWRAWGVTPDAVVGHSVGEVAAAYVAGALSLADALLVVAQRGRVMQPAKGLGRMAAVDLTLAEAEELCRPHQGRLNVAAINSPGAVVLAGEPAALEAALEQVRERNIFNRMLQVDFAFHSQQMLPFRDELAAALRGIAPRPTSIPLFSTVTGGLCAGEQMGAEHWCRNMHEPVRFAAAVDAAIEDQGSLFVEIGPHPALGKPIRQCLGARKRSGGVVASLRRGMDSLLTMLDGLGGCYTQGYPVDWQRRFPSGGRCVALPTYPWQRERFWFDPPLQTMPRLLAGQTRAGTQRHPLLGAYTILDYPQETHIWEGLFDRLLVPFIGDHVVQGAVVFPATAYLEMVSAATAAAFGEGSSVISSIEFHQLLFLPEGHKPVLQIILTVDPDGQIAFRIASRPRAGEGAESWTVHVSGRLDHSRAAVPVPTLGGAELAAIQARCAEQRSGERFYHYLGRRGNHWGQSFQGISRLWRGEAEALAEVLVPEGIAGEAGFYRFHPAVADACGQVLAATIGLEPSSGPRGGAFVGKGMRQIRIYGRAEGRRFWSHVTARRSAAENGATLEGDLRIFDESGRLVMEWLQLRFHYLDDRQPELAPVNLERWLYEVAWERQDRAAGAPAGPDARPWLVFSEGGALGAALVQRLEAQGDAVVVVTPGDSFGQTDQRTFRVRPGVAEDLQHLLSAALGERPQCRGVVHLWSQIGLAEGLTLDEAFEDAHRRGSLSVLQLVQAIVRAGPHLLPRIWLATCGAQALGAAPGLIAVEQAPLWGFGRTLALEHPDLWGGLIELDPAAEPALAAAELCAEISAPGGEDQIAFRDGLRYVARLVRHSAPAARRQPFRWQTDGSYLVTGGLGGLGLTVARWMVSQGARHLILMGRTQLPPRRQWGQITANSTLGRQIAAIRELESFGAHVHLAAVDVGDETQLREFLRVFEAEGWPPIRGVMHAAGVVNQALIQELDAEKLRTVLRPKVIGGWLLHELLRDQPLDFFVLFSSSSALLSSPHLAGYAAGNAFLDALAHLRHSQGRPALSINWGAWAEVGFVTHTQIANTVLLERDSILPEQGVAMLQMLLRQTNPQVAVIPIDWQHWTQLYSVFTTSPLLQHVLQEVAPATSEPAAPVTQLALDEADPETRQRVVGDYLTEQVARVLGLSAARLDAQRSLTSLGLDSLMAVELKTHAERSLGVHVSMVTFLQGSSVAQLTELFCEQIRERAELVLVGVAEASEALYQAPADREVRSQILAYVEEPSALARMPALAEPTRLPLSYGQQALWFLYQSARDSAAYNISFSARVVAEIDRAALRRALQTLVDRHPPLRSTFAGADAEPFQQIHPRMAVALEELDAAGWSDERLEAQARAAAHRPFDLEQGPVFRAHLFSRSPGEHVLVLAVHHIAGDLWSLLVLLDELRGAYQAAHAGTAPALPALEATYADYTRWQRELLDGPQGQRLRSYWGRQLAGELPALNLPLDHPRPPVQTYRGASRTLVLPERLSQQLKALAQQEQTTLFTVLLAAYQVLLHRYTGQTDLAVGSPVFGRDQARFGDTVGDFINMIVLRGRVSGARSFRELLGELRATVLDGLAHQDYPFPTLVEQLQPARDPSRAPIFQTGFMLQRLQRFGELLHLLAPASGAPARVDFGGLRLEPFFIPQQEGQVDLMLELFDRPGGISGSLKYNPDLFEAATIERMVGHFQALLEGVVADPGQSVARLPLLTPPEREQVLVQWNATETPLAASSLVHGAFAAQAARTPAAVAVVCGEQQLTYRELDEQSNRLAHHLQRLGARAGTLIGLYVERSADMLVGLLGIMKTGAAYIPLDPVYPPDRVAYMLTDAGAPIVVTQRGLAADLAGHPARLVELDGHSDALAAESPAPLAARIGGDDLAYIIYTSGSTGKPKGVPIPHRAVVNFLNAMRRAPGLSADDVLLAVTTLSFDIAGLELYLPITTGARVVVARREETVDGAALLALIERSGATVMQATPATWQMLLDAGWRRGTLKALCGGEAIPRELAEQVLTRCGELWNMYGPTETTIWSTTERLLPGAPLISIGRPIDNTLIYVLDSALQPVPVGVAGELYIGGDAPLSPGYFRRPELAAEKFIPDPFSTTPGARMYNTGDLARYLPDGRLVCLGRSDHQVKVRGFRIELGEIETVLGRQPEVREAVVVASGSDVQNKRLVAYLVPSAAQAPSPAALRNALKEHLPDYMIPSVFVVLEALPRTPNGKVDRKALPAPERAAPRTADSYSAPQSELERVIAGVWQEVLNLEQVGTGDNFFDLGGHSLLIGRVRGRLQELFGRPIATVDLFRHTTVSALAAFLQQGQEARPATQQIQERANKRAESINRRRNLLSEQKK